MIIYESMAKHDFARIPININIVICYCGHALFDNNYKDIDMLGSYVIKMLKL